MIIDKLTNSDLYAHNDSLKKAFAFLKDLREFPEEGRVEIRGSEIFANIDRYQTKLESECRMEAHRRYIDIQILFSGSEIIAWHPVADLQEETPYDNERDVAFFLSPPGAAGQGGSL